jgi:hypothetical protein
VGQALSGQVGKNRLYVSSSTCLLELLYSFCFIYEEVILIWVLYALNSSDILSKFIFLMFVRTNLNTNVNFHCISTVHYVLIK